MTQKKARHLMLELSRRVYLNANGNLKGFGKVAKFYDDQWHPNLGVYDSYESAWNAPIMTDLRNRVGM